MLGTTLKEVDSGGLQHTTPVCPRERDVKGQDNSSFVEDSFSEVSVFRGRGGGGG